MKKSFKRALATILAVLMVVTAFPMTAFAKLGDLSPNVNLRFSTFSPAMASSGGHNYWTNTLQNNGTAQPNVAWSGLKGSPLKYENGQLVLTKAMADKAREFPLIKAQSGAGLSSDYTYQVGDTFALTVTTQGVDTLWAAEMYLKYSNNIEPAGIYQYTDGTDWTTPKYGIYTKAEAENMDNTVGTGASGSPSVQCVLGGEKAWADQSAVKLYKGDINLGATGDTSYVRDGIIFVTNTNQNGKVHADVSGFSDPTFTDQNTGRVNPAAAQLPAYVYKNEVIMETFIFKITGEGPIEIDLDDKDNHRGGYQGCYYCATKLDGIDADHAYTYAPNPINPAGGAKITFMGTNIHNTPVPPAHEHTYDANWTHGVIDGVQKHWHECTDAQCPDKVASRKDIADCAFTSEIVKAPTCTAEGEKKFTCSTCGNTYTEPIAIDANAHQWGEPVFTFAENGKTVTSVIATCALNAQHTTDLTSATTVTSAVLTPATPTEMGTTRYTATVEFNGQTYTATKDVKDIPATGYTYQEPTMEPSADYSQVTFTFVCNEDPAQNIVQTVATTSKVQTPATCKAEGSHIYSASYDLNGKTYTYTSAEVFDIPVLEHQWAVDPAGAKQASTCKTAGFETHKCSLCGETKQVALELDPTNHEGEGTHVVGAKDATCKAPGYTGDTVCNGCGVTIATGQEIAQLEHQWAVDPTGAKQASTCKTAGFETHKCSLCGDTKQVALALDPSNHTGEGTKVINQKDATLDAPGYTGDTVCAGCGVVLEMGKEIPMLEGYTVTVTEDGLGQVAGLNFGANKLAKNAEYTVTATALPGATFLGWYNGDKLLTTEATYTSVATSDVTLTPKFAEEGTDKITVTFLDMWGNTVKQFDSVTVADYQAAVAKEMPKATDVAGYQFAGWDMTDEQIKAISTSQTVRAKYTLKADGFTVTLTDGATFVNGTVDGTNVKYDTLVEVKATGAKAWKIGSTIVGYGDTYSFYVGSDVTISPVFDGAVTAKPETAIVNVAKTNTAVVNFLATRTVPEGYTLVNAGFVFGKTDDANSLVIENADKAVNGVKIHVGYCRVGGADQFLLPYGVKSMTGTIGARSFVTVKTADGAIQTIYSDVASYIYK